MKEFRSYQELCEYDAEVVEGDQLGSSTGEVAAPEVFRTQWGRGRRPARFKLEFTFADLAVLCGCSVKRIRNLKALGVFDPRDLASVAALLRSRKPKET